MGRCLPIRGEEESAVAAGLASLAGFRGTRLRALVELGMGTGYRISELLSLDLPDVVDEAGKIREEVTVSRRRMKGKGSGRTMPLGGRARSALVAYLSEARRYTGTTREGPLFVTKQGRRVSRFQAYRQVAAFLGRCGIVRRNGRALGTHTLRKTFAYRVQRALLVESARRGPGEVDVFCTLVRLMGHGDPKSTMSYIEWDAKDWTGLLLEVGA